MARPFRKKLSKRGSRKMFSRTARKVHKKNFNVVKRGGQRM